MPSPQNKGRSAGLCPLRRIRCFSAPPAGTKGGEKPPALSSVRLIRYSSATRRPPPAWKGGEKPPALCVGLVPLLTRPSTRPPERKRLAPFAPPLTPSSASTAPSLLLTHPFPLPPERKRLAPFAPCRIRSRTAPSAPPLSARARPHAHPFRPAALRPSAASGRPSFLPSAPHTLIFSITWIFFPLKEFSFLETIRFLCNYVSVVVFYLNFFRRHAMKSLLCFFLGLAFLPVPASAIEHLPPPLTPFK